jgi:sugar/nucleoside kinase (ribokinase family)
VERVDVLVIGDANPDLILRGGDLGPVAGQREALAEEATLTLGGSGSIFACAAARLGLRVAIAGVVGDDVFGGYVRDRLGAQGVDTRGLVVRTGRPTGVSVVLSRPDDRGTYTAPGTIAELRASDVDRSILAAARHVHVASYFLLRGLGPGLPELFDEARAGGATTSVDPNWDPTQRWDDGVRELLGRVDLFLPNATEAVRIAGVDAVGEAVRRLAALGPAVAVKLGGEGGLVRRGDETARADGLDVEVVDTTGAGDAFDAGFVLGLLEGWPLRRSLAFASACGGLSCRAVGGVDGLPTRAEVLARLPEGWS